MAWSMELSHLDVDGHEDAAYIVARETVTDVVRSPLIEEGRPNQVGSINVNLRSHGIAALDITGVTHDEADRFNGIRALMVKTTRLSGPTRKD